ncbi:hypothetical protein EI94DRAFT_240740 [Lactarius quietus]|nr:hypothetical protein EI94DRAFT_240740 [Lactarius quietus]
MRTTHVVSRTLRPTCLERSSDGAQHKAQQVLFGTGRPEHDDAKQGQLTGPWGCIEGEASKRNVAFIRDEAVQRCPSLTHRRRGGLGDPRCHAWGYHLAVPLKYSLTCQLGGTSSSVLLPGTMQTLVARRPASARKSALSPPTEDFSYIMAPAFFPRTSHATEHVTPVAPRRAACAAEVGLQYPGRRLYVATNNRKHAGRGL